MYAQTVILQYMLTHSGPESDEPLKHDQAALSLVQNQWVPHPAITTGPSRYGLVPAHWLVLSSLDAVSESQSDRPDDGPGVCEGENRPLEAEMSAVIRAAQGAFDQSESRTEASKIELDVVHGGGILQAEHSDDDTMHNVHVTFSVDDAAESKQDDDSLAANAGNQDQRATDDVTPSPPHQPADGAVMLDCGPDPSCAVSDEERGVYMYSLDLLSHGLEVLAQADARARGDTSSQLIPVPNAVVQAGSGLVQATVLPLASALNTVDSQGRVGGGGMRYGPLHYSLWLRRLHPSLPIGVVESVSWEVLRAGVWVQVPYSNPPLLHQCVIAAASPRLTAGILTRLYAHATVARHAVVESHNVYTKEAIAAALQAKHALMIAKTRGVDPPNRQELQATIHRSIEATAQQTANCDLMAALTARGNAESDATMADIQAKAGRVSAVLLSSLHWGVNGRGLGLYAGHRRLCGPALSLAVEYDNQSMVDLLLRVPEIEVDAVRPHSGRSAAHIASFCASYVGVTIDVCVLQTIFHEYASYPPLLIVCHNRSELLRQLLQRGQASALLSDSEGETPLYSAVRGNQYKTVCIRMHNAMRWANG